MGMARILMNPSVSGQRNPWNWPYESTSGYQKIVMGEGLQRVKKLTTLLKKAGCPFTEECMKGSDCYTLEEREAVFKESKALDMATIQSGEFEVLVVKWEKAKRKTGPGHTGFFAKA